MPALSYFFGIKPADLDDMRLSEVTQYLDELAEIEKTLRRSRNRR